MKIEKISLLEKRRGEKKASTANIDGDGNIKECRSGRQERREEENGNEKYSRMKERTNGQRKIERNNSGMNARMNIERKE